ncbi:MAG TPA: phosphate acetyltransferase [Thermodesulfobacteriota bacterium]|nr:phosphate acetyltransferase [Thermodesulfobacteriota bacterium]
MGHGVYLLSSEPRSGRTLFAVGLMEGFNTRMHQPALFRPVVSDGPEMDPLIAFSCRRYGLSFAYEDLYGATQSIVQDLITTPEKREELYGIILDKYKQLEALSDFIVVVGTGFRSAAPLLEFDANADLANHLGLPILPMVNAFEKSPHQVVESVLGLSEVLNGKGSQVLSYIVNRVDPDQKEAVRAALIQRLGDDFPLYVLPEHPLLEKPTVRDIAEALKADRIAGAPEAFDGLVRHFKVAAMELPHFLDRLEEGSLVIVPGDRSDIILGTIAADRSPAYPRCAGLLLTGGLRPPIQIMRLLENLRQDTLPIMAVETDTFTTTQEASRVEPGLITEDSRKLAAAAGMVASCINIPDLLNRIAVVLPIKITPLMFQHDLLQRARRELKHIVLPEGEEERILRAAEIVLLHNVCRLTLLGKVDQVTQRIAALGLSLKGVSIIDPADSEWRQEFAEAYFQARKHKGISPEMAYDTIADVSYFGTMMVHLNRVDGMVSGAVHTTAHTIRPALEVIKTRPDSRVVSGIFFMCLPDQVLVYGDCAVNPDPTAEELADIAVNSALTATAFGIEPRVAMLSYSSGESGSGPDVDKVRLATALTRQRRPDLKVDGPIQYDAAIDADVGRLKMPGSAVAGQATVFIFPDLNSGNNAYKAVQRAAGALAIGPVLQGLNKPVNDLSRGATVADIVNTIAITAVQAQHT